MSDERRIEHRSRFCFEGFSVFAGALNEVKIRDVTANGVGLLSVNALKRGGQGVLFARLPSSSEMEQVPIKVCWCLENEGTAGDSYQFRVGLKILENSGDSKSADQEVPLISLDGPEAQPDGSTIQVSRHEIRLERIQICTKREVCRVGPDGRGKKCDE